MDKEKIQKQAKQILDKFASALSKVEKKDCMETNVSLTSHPSLVGVDRDDFERVEGKGEESEKGFKKKILENAPEHDDDFIIVEKGSWK